MSLIHWWPLNGDTKDYGLDPVNMEIISPSTVTTTSGKIGKCYYNNSNSSGGIISTSTVHIGTVQSMFCWMKFVSLEEWSGLGGAMVGTHRYPTNTGMGITIKYLSSTTGRISVNTGTGSSRTFNTYYGNTTLNADTWYHVGFTYDGSTIRLYVNGALDGSASYSGMSVPDDYIFIGAWSLSGGSGNRALYTDYKLNGYINDVRVYNHALSTKDVKDLSKGLVLYYKFSDEEIEGTTNIDPMRNNLNDNLSYPTGMGRSGVEAEISIVDFDGYKCYKLNIQKDNISSWWGVYLNSNPISQGASVGQTVTRSMMMYIPSGQTLPGHFTESIEGNSTNKTYVNYDYTRPNTWQRVSSTGTIADTGANNYLHYFCAVSSGSVHVICYMRDFQMEIKDHPTPYTNTNRPENLVASLTAGGKTTIDGTYSLHTNASDSDTYFYINFNRPMTFGKKYYITCDVSGFENASDYWQFPCCSQGYPDSLYLRNGRCAAIFEYRSSSWTDETRMILDDLNFTNGVRSRSIYITNIRVTEAPSVFDSSGFNHNGIIVGNPPIKTDSTALNGKYIDLTSSQTYITTENFSFLTTGTVIVWAKYPSSLSGSKMILGDSLSTSPYLAAAGSDNKWYHNSVGSITCYRDGSANNYLLRDDNWHCYAFTGVDLSTWAGLLNICFYGGYNNAYQFYGQLADIKIYNTVFSAADVLKEYRTMAGLDKSYNLGSKTFNEDSEGKLYPIISNNGSEIAFDSNNFKTMKLSDGSTWARILWHDVTTDTSMFASVAEAQYCTTKSNRFSLLGAIEKFKSTNNYYEFIYALPELGTIQNGFYNRWKQTSNPITTSIGTSSGYTAINIKWSNYFSGGIARSADSGSTYLDTTVGTGASNWWGALGQFTIYQGGFPCSNAAVQKKVELWIRVDNTPMADIASGNVYRLNKNGVFNASEINELGFDSENHFVTYDTGKLVARSFNEK